MLLFSITREEIYLVKLQTTSTLIKCVIKSGSVIKDIMIVDASFLLAADAADVVATKLHLARRLEVVVERTFLALYTELLQLTITSDHVSKHSKYDTICLMSK